MAKSLTLALFHAFVGEKCKTPYVISHDGSHTFQVFYSQDTHQRYTCEVYVKKNSRILGKSFCQAEHDTSSQANVNFCQSCCRALVNLEIHDKPPGCCNRLWLPSNLLPH